MMVQSLGMWPPLWSYMLCARGLMLATILRITGGGMVMAVFRNRALNASALSLLGVFWRDILSSTSCHNEKSNGFKSGE